MNGEVGNDSRRPKCLLDILLLKLHIEDQVLDEGRGQTEARTHLSQSFNFLIYMHGSNYTQTYNNLKTCSSTETINIGHDTTAVAVKGALYLIGLYPVVQERIHQELDSVLGADSKGPLSFADLNELKFWTAS
ncbi:hypothetical protein CEXT_545461 [Caerostris extrusa]|uniref:Cytochrome P450 n=1 Tax=Caerostris extrusa TaxID=172846 RepID=A0AAV4NLV5_CAEEX|nr:hypothetical protein CEXT_545461 [Caerostris extrusa]